MFLFAESAQRWPHRRFRPLSVGGLVLLACVAAPVIGVAGTELDEKIVILGSQHRVEEIPGSAYFIGPEELEKFFYSDIQRIVREVPGVSVQVEDGYGLRPNISIRGVATERSGRITLLEDNVLIAPAPYSAPAAYYFPTPGRMYAFEVLKGPAAITQGPYTIGGALNMISTPIPEKSGGTLLAEGGEDATRRAHGYYGGGLHNGFSFLLETHQWGSDGFQHVDRSGVDTGLSVDDYTFKLGYQSPDERHRVNFKFQYADQDSDQSYLGLTDADFDADSYRRYGVSSLDNIKTEHHQYILSYQFDLSDEMSFSVTAYDNEHERTWFKTEGLDADGSMNAEDFDRTSWFSIIQAINKGEDHEGLTPAELQAILDGTMDTADGSIQLRSNAREYYSRGVQLGFNWQGELGAMHHDLEVGVRYHEDEEDRLQRNSTYHQENGELVLDDLGELGNAGNRVQEAEAVAIHVYDSIDWGNWTFSPGVRYEDISQKRTRYSDGAARVFRDSRRNHTSVWLPGLGVLYRLSDEWTLLAGVHKGFTAPSNAPGVDEEDAINYEFGFRYAGANLRGEVIGFVSDYDNILGECTSSSGSDCEAGDAFNGDAATVEGVEALFTLDLTPDRGFNTPFSLSYTYMDAEFDSDVADTDFFGDVSKGDPIPYVPEHQMRASVGIEKADWAAYLSANYVDEVCVRASCGRFERTDETWTLDLAANYRFTDKVEIFGRVENLTDEDDVVARHPYGARPNKDRTATAGLRLKF